MDQNLIMFGIHKETRDREGNLKRPANIIKIYDNQGIDCLGDRYIATCEQVYARPNKNMNKNVICVDDFKGKTGLKELMYNREHIYDFLKMIINDGYIMKRTTKHKGHELADDLFQFVMSCSIQKDLRESNEPLLNF